MNLQYVNLRDTLTDRYGVGEAKAIAMLVLEKAFGVTKIDIYADKVRDFSSFERQCLENITQRLKKGEPVQYVLGEADFCGRTFRVGPEVLIPRPETEDLVEMVTERLKKGGLAAPCLLDAGTGSGCIAVSIALNFPRAVVEAWDLSEGALKIAQENAARLGAKVRFVRRDMLLRLVDDDSSYDFIVSNPPYILEKEREGMDSHVLDSEPSEALFVPDEDPLRFYHALSANASNGLLRRGGELWVEVNRAYASETATCFCEAGLKEVRILKDRFDVDRFVCGIRP